MSDEDTEIKGIKHSDKLTMVDRLRSKMHPVMDRADTGEVVYPRKDFLQNQAAMRQAAYDEEQLRKSGGKK